MIKRFGLLLIFLLSISPAQIIAQGNDDQKSEACNILKSSYYRSGFKYARIQAGKLISRNNSYSVNQNSMLNFCDSLYKTGNIEEALFFLETGITLSEDPPIRMIRYLASLSYLEGMYEKSERAMDEYIRISGEAIKKDYLAKTGEDILSTKAETIIERYIEATGGHEAWSKIQSMKITFTMQPNAGRDIKLVRYYKRPFYYRQEVPGSNSFYSTNGTTTWACSDGNWSESDINYRFASLDNYSINYKQLGIKYDMIGLEVLDSDAVYHLRRTFRDGFSQDLFFSAESGLLVETKSIYPESHPLMESFFSAWDYREIGGVLIPHIFIRNVGEMGPPHGLVVSDIEINPELPDSLFLPAKK